MTDQKSSKIDPKQSSDRSSYRIILAIVIGLIVITYIIGSVSGYIPKERQIDTVQLAIMGLAVLGIILLIRPDYFGRVKRLQTGAFNLELFEEELQSQRSDLNDIKMMLPLLFPLDERQHLLNLYEGNTRDYRGRHSVRSELRRLRSSGLIEMQSGHYVGHIENDKRVNLSEYVKLTKFGTYWARRIKEIDEADRDEGSLEP